MVQNYVVEKYHKLGKFYQKIMNSGKQGCPLPHYLYDSLSAFLSHTQKNFVFFCYISTPYKQLHQSTKHITNVSVRLLCFYLFNHDKNKAERKICFLA